MVTEVHPNSMEEWFQLQEPQTPFQVLQYDANDNTTLNLQADLQRLGQENL